MSNNKSFLFLGGVVLISILAVILFETKKVSSPPINNSLATTTSNNDACASTNENDRQICLMGVEKSLFENYLKNNISDLSLVKEVLGGKFYVTKINWQPDRLAVVDYEDGHIALQAKVVFGANYANGWPESVEIKSFEITPDL